MRHLILGTTLLLALSACASGNDESLQPAETVTVTESPSSSAAEPEPPAEPAASSEDDLRAAAETFFVAFFGGDGAAAYEMLSDRCKGATPLSEYASVVEAANELYGQVQVEIRDVRIDGDRGLVDADTGVPALEQSEPGFDWVMVDGRWLSDKCG